MSCRKLRNQQFSPLNVMVLLRKPNVPDRPAEMRGQRFFGNHDEMFLQSKPKRGLLTPMEVRVIALAELDLGPRSVVWDVGAGSGSVAIEAARLAKDGTTYAIEMDGEDHQLIIENSDRFGVSNLVPVLGQAPDAWRDLPDPDSVFVGGSGRAISGIVEQAIKRLRSGGRLVANVSSIDNVSSINGFLRESEGTVETRMINVSHSMDQLDRVRFESLNPTFLITFLKG